MNAPPIKPYRDRSRGLWSLWEMLELDAQQFTTLLHTLFDVEIRERGKSGPLGDGMMSKPPGIADDIMHKCLSLELPVSATTADNMIRTATTMERLHESIRQLSNSVMLELKGKQFYGPLSRYIRYYNNQQLFGAEVFKNFPSANDDICEAGMCLAFERATACVLHLMRVLEVGLTVLAKTVGVPKQNDWGAYLREIGKGLDRLTKSSGARTSDEQFYAESAANFGRLRTAYRNPTMHPDKTYSQERAEEILMATKSFMSHLATKISEQEVF
jgi:hypothetical protein